MKTFIMDIIPRLSRFSQRLDDLTKLTNQHWVSLGEITDAKKVYIFRQNNQLVISENGIVQKGSWEYLDNSTLLLETKDQSYLLRHGFFDENILALKLDSTNSYALFINETKHHKELNSIDDVISFLEAKYLKKFDQTNNVNFKSQTSINETNIANEYEVIKQFDSFDIIWGNYTCYVIKFSSGRTENIYKGTNSGKYFYADYLNGKTYCTDFNDAVYKLYCQVHRR